MIEWRLAKLGGDLKGNPFKAVVDLVDHEKLQMKHDVSARGMVEEMLTMQFLVSILPCLLSFFVLISRLTLFSRSQGFLRSTLLYCYFRKVSTTEEAKTSRTRLKEVEGENAKLKEAMAKMEEDLRVLSKHSAMMECEASDASKA
jgi:hypothetical protein